MPAGDWHTLDFGDHTNEGVEVVEFLDPVLRQVDLTGRNLTYSW
jgi:hypothetical protein